MANEPTPDPRAAARGSAPIPDTAALADALQQLSTLLLLTAEAADTIAAMLTGQPVNTAADMYPDSDPYAEPVRTDSQPVRTGHRTDTTPDIRPDNGRPVLSVVRPRATDTTEDSE